jgi:NAD-dependent dihydropyrimidine dehydrogenase PreA subunit
MVDVAKFFMDFIQRESCGKCIPCREGTRRMLEILDRDHAADARTRRPRRAVERFRGVMRLEKLAGRHQGHEPLRPRPDGAQPGAEHAPLVPPRVRSPRLRAQLPGRRLPRPAHYSIDADACKGCTLCAKNCPTGAILGDRKEVHRIDQERCIACGSCITSCEFDAVIAK